jgi:hypothetical protein
MGDLNINIVDIELGHEQLSDTANSLNVILTTTEQI